MKRFSNDEAMEVVKACVGNSFALAQALDFAAAVVWNNARHPYSDWTMTEYDTVFMLGANPDLVEALGHTTPEFYLFEIQENSHV